MNNLLLEPPRVAEDIGSSGRHLGRRWTRTFGPGRRAAAEHARLERSHPSPCEAPNAIRGRSGGEGEVGGHGRLLPPRPLVSPGFLAYAQSAVNPRQPSKLDP